MDWSNDNINKYLSRIEGSIIKGRYNLALKLANRLLKRYYRSFITTKIPTEIEKENLRKMSVCISKYLVQHNRNCSIPYSERRLLMMAITTDVVDIHNLYTHESEEDSIVDHATATYVFENVKSVVRYLRRYF
ncbi:MAG: hypothetical protein NXI23_05105 [Bacteroidetes bacterium]|jgi:DNA-binding Lrp family transcriptional regulator|nr:hypothetical protein [Bacteroidota bacterium]MDF1863218.1 hypothetical protein [Saprospiraceae bacterium]